MVRVATVAPTMQVQPADFGANLTNWFRLLGSRWKQLLWLSLVAFVPVGIAILVLFYVVDLPRVFEQLINPDMLEEMTLDDLIDLIPRLAVAGGIAISVQIVATSFVYVGASRITACHLAEVETDWRAASWFAIGRLGRAIGAQLILTIGALIILGTVAALSWGLISTLDSTFLAVFLTAVLVLTAFVVLIWLSFSLTLVSQSIAMTDNSVIEALKQSFTLVQRRWWVSVGFFLVTGLIASVAAQVITVPLLPLFIVGIAAPGLLSMIYVATGVVQGPIAAAMAVAYSLWYVDLRAREGHLTASDLIR